MAPPQVFAKERLCAISGSTAIQALPTERSAAWKRDCVLSGNAPNDLFFCKGKASANRADLARFLASVWLLFDKRKRAKVTQNGASA